MGQRRALAVQCRIYSVIASSAIPVTQAGVLQVAPTTTGRTETTHTKCELHSRGFSLRVIVYFEDIWSKYSVGSSKCVIKFSVKSNNLMLGNAFIITASIDVIWLSPSPKKVKLSYTVSFARHLPSTSAIRLDMSSREPRCDANSFIAEIDVREFPLAPKMFKDIKPWK